MSFDQKTLKKNISKFLNAADSRDKAALVAADAIAVELDDAHIVILERNDWRDLCLMMYGVKKNEAEALEFDIENIVNSADSCFGVDERKRSQIIQQIPFLRDKHYISCNVGGSYEDPGATMVAIVYRKDPPFLEEDEKKLKIIIEALDQRLERLEWNNRLKPRGLENEF